MQQEQLLDLWGRIIALFRKHQLDQEFDDEARSHVALCTDDYVRRGVPFAEAERLARVKFGSIEASKDAERDARGLPWLEGLFYDLRLTLRGLRRDRAFTVAAVAMMALAIGLNVTVFTIMDAMLFRGFPHVKQNNRLVYLQERHPSGLCCMSYPDFEDWRARAHAFEAIAYVGGRTILLSGGDARSVETDAFAISANTFSLLRVAPQRGRDFVPADELAGAAPVAILNHRFWESQFGKRRDIIGLTVTVSGTPTTIVGVMPEGFDFPTKESLWLPVSRTPDLYRRGLTPRGFTAVGRLRDGASIKEARAQLETINRRLETDYPQSNRGLVPTLVTHADFTSGGNAYMIWGSLWAAAWFVLLIACANLANLTLVRTIARSREFSTRIALGAGQARMIRQIFMENFTLACAAGAIAWWITNWSVRAWATNTASRYQVLDYAVNSGTLAYLAAIPVAAAVLCSLAPIAKVVQLGVTGVLKGDARGLTQGLRGKRFAAALVAGQMAMAIVLLSGAGVLLRSFVSIVTAETGVRDPQNVLAGFLRLPAAEYPNPSTRLSYFHRLESQLRTIPGIVDVSVAATIPVNGVSARPFEIEGRPNPPNGPSAAQFLTVSSGYFQVVGVSPLAGRGFNNGDQLDTSKVIIVNQSFAAAFFPGKQPLGERIRAVNGDQPGEWRTIVGVVPNIMQGDGIRQNFRPVIYFPLRQGPLRVAFFLARTRIAAEQLAQAVRARIQSIDSGVTLEDVTSLKASFAFDRDRMDPDHSELGKHAAVAPVFAIIALLLTAAGLYAVLAHSISQRTKEIGVRMAVGAAAENIRSMVFRDGMLPVSMGLIFGMAASLAVNRILQSQLVGVLPYDPLTITAAPLLLILVALLACHIPARRAMNVDPAVALRHD